MHIRYLTVSTYRFNMNNTIVFSAFQCFNMNLGYGKRAIHSQYMILRHYEMKFHYSSIYLRWRMDQDRFINKLYRNLITVYHFIYGDTLYMESSFLKSQNISIELNVRAHKIILLIETQHFPLCLRIDFKCKIEKKNEKQSIQLINFPKF